MDLLSYTSVKKKNDEAGVVFNSHTIKNTKWYYHPISFPVVNNTKTHWNSSDTY